MSFFVTAVSGLWGLKIKLVQVLKMPCTGREKLSVTLPAGGFPLSAWLFTET